MSMTLEEESILKARVTKLEKTLEEKVEQLNKLEEATAKIALAMLKTTQLLVDQQFINNTVLDSIYTCLDRIESVEKNVK